MSLPEMPANTEIERELLATLLHDPAVFPYTLKKVTSGMFYLTEHKNIYKGLTYLYNKHSNKYDSIMLLEALKENFMDVNDAAIAVADLMNKGYSTDKLDWYIDQTIYYASRRKLMRLSLWMQKNANDISVDITEILLKMESTANLVQSVVKSEVNLADDIEEMSLHLGNKDATIPFGIPVLDNKVAGFMRSDITTLGGRTSHGKTTFSIDNIKRQVEMGFSVDVITNEVAKRLYLQKLGCNVANVEYQKIIKFGEVSDEERDKFQKAKEHMLEKYVGKLRIHEFVDNITSIVGIIGSNKPDVFWLDWLQRIPLVPGLQDGKEWIKVVYSELAKVSAKTNTASVVVSQLSTRKAQTRSNKRPELFDFDDSSFIEKASCDCHLLYWYFNDTRIPEYMSVVELINAKNRFGEPSLSLLSHDPKAGRYNDSKLLPKQKVQNYMRETGLTAE